MKIVNRKIKDLIGAEYNPRELTKDQYKQLKDSLLRFGVVDPVIVNKHPERDNIIIGGHQRSKVWGDMGNESIPTVELSLTLDKEKELNVRLNKNTGQFDMDMLANNFDTEDLIEWGFDEGELVGFDEVDLEAEEDEFDVPEGGIETDIVLGDLFEIGEHRLLCGDSTNSDDVERLMDSEKVDMVFTDPPYGISHSGKGIKGSAQENDFGEILGDNDVTVAIDSFNLCQSLFPDSLLIFWGANYYSSCLPNGFGWLIWDKQREGDTFSGAEIAFVNKSVKVDVFRHQWHGMIKASEMGEKRVHPTQKPIALADWSFNNYKAGVNILDLFLGSGTTMVASEKSKRKCFGMELDPKYCQVIVNRMMKLDDSLVVKLNGEPYEKELVSL